MPDIISPGEVAISDASTEKPRWLSRRRLLQRSAEAAVVAAGAGVLIGNAAQPAMAAVWVDSAGWGPIVLNPDQYSQWWFTWGNHTHPDRWIVFWATPDNWPANVEIVRQWSERDISGVTKSWVLFHNNGGTVVVFRPIAISAPRPGT